jgi:hypothetical protein
LHHFGNLANLLRAKIAGLPHVLNGKDAQVSVEGIRKAMHAFQGEPAGRKSGVPSRQLWSARLAPDGYPVGQSGWTVNYPALVRSLSAPCAGR